MLNPRSLDEKFCGLVLSMKKMNAMHMATDIVDKVQSKMDQDVVHHELFERSN